MKRKFVLTDSKLFATLLPFTGLINNVNDTIGNNPRDKQLVDRVLRGDNGAFAIIMKNTENLVAQIVFKMVANLSLIGLIPVIIN